jgi:AmmeMemoRadiSam system protein B
MESVRPPAVAGGFYPADPEVLRREIEGLLGGALQPEAGVAPRLLIVPHAGYVYSGAVAAVAYRLAQERCAWVRTVVLLGPSHFVGLDGIAHPGAEAVATPLGEIPVDGASPALHHPAVRPDPGAHAREHSLEVQWPFLQVVFPDAAVVPLVTGDVDAVTAGDVLDAALDPPGTLGVVSSDLSHYLDYEAAIRKDEATAEAIAGMRPGDVGFDDACGRLAVQAALLTASRRNWEIRRLALCNSGDTAGSKSRVVGYGAFVAGPVA